ncbi:hypothetical protein CTAYLR_002036 [Chrysophaeum taylorii]|uniref:C2 domain-containing protein n=1 Tax=Chrysophaeum taylorii TaxID=2483200 RepID=A0AAD7UNB3_9STRA|nr:hypothetical protein CTAYLR_002036 [Chrysophaeum taylorii]
MITILAVVAVLAPVSRSDCSGGEVYLSVKVCCASVKNADGTPGSGRSDPYCKVSSSDKEKKTSTKNNDDHPTWNEVLDLGCVPADAEINVHCFDHDSYSSDDSLVHVHLDDWYSDGDNGETYRLPPDASHWVEFDVMWAPDPTLAPTVAPTLAPTAAATVATARDAQFTESRLYDSTRGACYDSPLLGTRIQIDDVRMTAAFDDSSYVVADGPGPWRAVRVLGAVPNASCGTVRGLVAEVGGETVLEEASFQAESCVGDGWVLPKAATGDVAASCGPVAAESLESVAILVGRAEVDGLAVDDGSGPAAILAGVPEGSRGVVTFARAVVRYVEGTYGLVVLDHDLVLVDNFTTPPSTTTPTLAPEMPETTAAPTPRRASSSSRHDDDDHERRRRRRRRRSSSTGVIVVVALVLVALFCFAAYYNFFQHYIPPRRRPRYRGAADHSVSEQTFELATVESISYDPDGDPAYAVNPIAPETPQPTPGPLADSSSSSSSNPFV